MNDAPLLSIRNVSQAFPIPGGGMRTILSEIELNLAEKEIVGLLGRSGSGKSTLLRLVAGLARPVDGEIEFRGAPIAGPVDGIAMVFQSFALFPWLNVLANVEIGLEARGVVPSERKRRALEAIDLIGLDGFESAYPRELSGGMRQRVGLARALVIEPSILMLDESFSALDVLTAENLRTDLVELWSEGRLPISGVIMVTHSIEEAVSMCDRVVVLSSNPGRIVREIKIDLPRPRDRYSTRFRALVEDIYVEMTTRLASAREADGRRRAVRGMETVLPNLSIARLSGMLEELAAPPYDGRADLPALAKHFLLASDDLFHVADTLDAFGFAHAAGGDLLLTDLGKAFALDMDTDQRKAKMRDILLETIALAQKVRRVLDERSSHTAPWSRFSDELEDMMTAAQARQTMTTLVDWGRFSELFAYDADLQLFSLDDPGS